MYIFNPENIKKLNETELIILKMKCRGMKYSDIAKKLGYQPVTVQWYASSFYTKFEFNKDMHWRERDLILKEKVCPFLDKQEIVLVLPTPSEPPPPPDPEILAIVLLDEQKGTSIAPVKPIEGPRNRWRGLAIIAIVSCIGLAIGAGSVGYYFYSMPF